MRSVLNVAVLVASLLLVSLIVVRTARSTEVIAAAASKATRASGDDINGNPIEGRRIYMRENCYVCHGGFAGGGMCPSLRHSRPDDDDVREVVRNGTPNGMPPFPELNEVDIQNLCAYFQSLRTPREPTFTHWWEPVPTR
jgi:mono/diheme cytochrome c family protein